MKKAEKKSRKLPFAIETVRTLERSALAPVQGGVKDDTSIAGTSNPTSSVG
jgi:hypothetical protein